MTCSSLGAGGRRARTGTQAPCCQPSAGSTSYRPAATAVMLSLLGKVAGKDFTQGRASVLSAIKQTQSLLHSPLLVLDISFVLRATAPYSSLWGLSLTWIRWESCLR